MGPAAREALEAGTPEPYDGPFIDPPAGVP